MWWRKSKTRDSSFSYSKSTTTVSTSVSVNGRQIELPDGADLATVAEMLAQSGLDQATIDQVLATVGNTAEASSSTGAESVQVACDGCSRTVAFGKGTCMYCGTALSLPDATATRTIDQASSSRPTWMGRSGCEVLAQRAWSSGWSAARPSSSAATRA